MTTLESLPRVETPRLIVSLPVPDDATRMLAFYERNREHFARWDPERVEEFYTLQYWSRTLAASIESYRLGQSLRLMIVERNDPGGPVVGICNFGNIIRGAFQCANLGYSIGREYEGKGLMFEALSHVIPYTFVHLALHRIAAGYIPINQRSGNLLRRLGFTVEGYARDYLLIAGKWEDHVLTALVNPYWPTPSPPLL